MASSSLESAQVSGSNATGRFPTDSIPATCLQPPLRSIRGDRHHSKLDVQILPSSTDPKDSPSLPQMPTTTWIEEATGLLIVVSGIFFGVPITYSALKYVLWILIWVLSSGWALLAVTGRWWLDAGTGAWKFTSGVWDGIRGWM